MKNKKIKLKLNENDLNICDFKNHAIEDNLLSSVTGGFPKVTHAKSSFLKAFAKASGPIFSEEAEN